MLLPPEVETLLVVIMTILFVVFVAYVNKTIKDSLQPPSTTNVEDEMEVQ